MVEDLHYVASEDNPADLATRGGVKLKDLGPGSFWQKGPSFLCSRRDLWPVNRDFISDAELPEDEIRSKRTYFCHMRAKVLLHYPVGGTNHVRVEDVQLPDLWAAVERVLNYQLAWPSPACQPRPNKSKTHQISDPSNPS